MPQLDAIRCYAVLLVLWSHTRLGERQVIGLAGVGVWGVWVFFVLSGFLITGILLRARDAAPSTERWGAWRAFYARRILRIFPLYYTVLLVAAAAGIGSSFRADFLWHLFYLSNWRDVLTGRGLDAAGPLWSLSVEEQFYLFWPAVVLLTRPSRLRSVLVGAMIAGIASRLVCVEILPMLFSDPGSTQVLHPTTSNLDSLALGGLLAWSRHGDAVPVRQRRRITLGALIVASLTACGCTVAYINSAGYGRVALLIFEPLTVALIAVWLIDRAADGFVEGTVLGRLLENRSAQHIGTVSYGVYLLHVPIELGLERVNLLPDMYAGVTENVVALAIVLAVTTLMASVSWFLFERPINRLKRFIPYERMSVPSVATTPFLSNA